MNIFSFRFNVFLAVAAITCFISAPRAEWIRDSIGIIGYSLTLPPNYSPDIDYPLFFYLHSAGTSATEDGAWPHNNENEGDNAILASDANQADYPCIVYAPQTPKYSANEHWVNLPGTGNGNWDYGTYLVDSVEQSTCMRDALAGLDTIISRYSVDTNRIYIGGGSMGGYGTYDCLCRGYYTRFACALPVSGAGDTTKAKYFKDLPIWAFADSGDEIIPFKFQAQMVKALEDAGGSPLHTFYSYDYIQNQQNVYAAHMIGHIWNIPFVLDPEIMPWIFEKSKDPTWTRTKATDRAPRASSRQVRSVISYVRSGAAATSIRLIDKSNGKERVFDMRGRPVFKQ